jgi:hypothetical protein
MKIFSYLSLTSERRYFPIVLRVLEVLSSGNVPYHELKACGYLVQETDIIFILFFLEIQ